MSQIDETTEATTEEGFNGRLGAASPETEAHSRKRSHSDDGAPVDLTDPTLAPGTVEHASSEDDQPDVEAHSRKRS